MKKTLTVVLVLLLTACLCVTAFAAEAEESGEASGVEVNRKIFDANELDALLAAHGSVQYTFEYFLDPAMNGVTWESKQAVYSDSASAHAEYSRDGVRFEMTFDEEADEFELRCVVELDESFDPFYRCTGDSFDDFFDPEYDRVTSVCEEDGLVYVVTENNEEMSRMHLEDITGEEYAGQIVRTESVADAETWELVRFTTYMVHGAEETPLYRVSVKYDVGEPIGCRVLRAAFERESENMVTRTYVVEPGTKQEFTREVTVPANTVVGVVGGDYLVLFDDPDGETLTAWDRLSDKTSYVFLDPDKEMIDHFEALYDEIMADMPDESVDGPEIMAAEEEASEA